MPRRRKHLLSGNPFGWNAIMLAIMALSFAELRAVDANLEQLVREFKSAAKGESGISQEQMQVAEKMADAGLDAIPRLIELLRDKTPGVSDLAGFALSIMKGLKEEHLDSLIASEREHHGWLPRAIASIGTTKAVEFLVEEFLKRGESGTQYEGAICIVAEKAVPLLLREYERDEDWGAQSGDLLYSLLGQMGVRAVTAVTPLTKIAADNAAPSFKRVRAIGALTAIGPAAAKAKPELLLLCKSADPKISEATMWALGAQGAAEAAAVFAERLLLSSKEWEKRMFIAHINRLGSAGTAAGPALLKQLSNPDWDLRVDAVFALGKVEARDFVSDLISLLDNVADWRLVYAAADSLGRMKSEAAKEALSRVSQEHWYGPVRNAASRALKSLGDPTFRYPEDEYGWNSDFHPSIDDVNRVTGEEAYSDRFALPVASPKFKRILVRGVKMQHSARDIEMECLEVDGGFLTGTDFGEWGGQILFVDRDGKPAVLAEVNTPFIHQSTHGVFAVTGLAHMTLNHGEIYRLKKSQDGRWNAEKWRQLPGAPFASRLLQDGSIFVTGYGGMTLIAPDGTMKSLTRERVLKP